MKQNSAPPPSYHSQPDTDVELELSVLARIYSRALWRHQETKKAGVLTAGSDDGKEVKTVPANTSISE